MLIKALCDYYDALARNGNVLSEGYSNVKIHYLVSLTLDVNIDDIINWHETVQREAAKGKIKEQSVP
ncbi:MAG: type I-C CRISPR-associated protein Cas8c/Csd1, partial [Clostridium sp.]|nr:type I-C CRISPR-associated protein Cas8c/Csd1 [Clostridium sp.]